MKKLVYIVLFTMSFMTLNAQQDPEAVPFLDKVSKDLDPGKSLKISFDYIREDLQTESMVEGEGSLYLLGDNYKLEMEDFVIFFDGEKQYSLNMEIEEVYISIPDPENREFMFSDPIKLLRKYKDEFKYRLVGVSNFQGMETTEIQLSPNELGGPYALLKLFVGQGNDQLKGIQVRHKEGILYSMIITTFETIEPLGPGFFKFDSKDHPNVDVIQLID